MNSERTLTGVHLKWPVLDIRASIRAGRNLAAKLNR